MLSLANAKEGGYDNLFQSQNMVELADMLAKRYGKLPTEILMGMSIFEFNYNVAIMLMTMELEHQRSNPKRVSPMERKSFSDLGFKVHTTHQVAEK